eukprot:c20881_g1_i1.p1 GENE.c20881_g1_i1~~c20881_g1_i1.p1  ORF type:complete len:341 (-),score=88.38 c20881_g1_i1:797-1792(-)
MRGMVRAIVYDPRAPGGMRMAEVLEPAITSATQVKLKVFAVSINPVDYKIPNIPFVGWKRRGTMVGIDVAGVVLEAGPASGFQVGDEVFGAAMAGAMGEVIVTETATLAPKPSSASFGAAAGSVVAGITGLQGLRDYGRLQPGGRAIVLGASGGCGSVGVSLAKVLGASHVVGVCSAKNAEFVTSVGADVVHRYDADGSLLPAVPEDEADRFDVVYDTVTSPEDHNYEPEAQRLLKRGGQYVAINGGATKWIGIAFKKIGLNFTGSNYHLFMADTNKADLTQLGEWLGAGKLNIEIAREFPFTEEAVREAFDNLKARRTRGKLIINVSQAS